MNVDEMMAVNDKVGSACGKPCEGKSHTKLKTKPMREWKRIEQKGEKPSGLQH